MINSAAGDEEPQLPRTGTAHTMDSVSSDYDLLGAMGGDDE